MPPFRVLALRAGLGAALLVTIANSPATAVDFGDDAGDFSYDGECDDPRFVGPGMTTTPLLKDDILHDATDCREGYEAGRLTLKGKPSSPSEFAVDFGDDAGDYANDGECDDPRFAGPGMTATTLIDDDILHDATDCREAYEAGRLTVK